VNYYPDDLLHVLEFERIRERIERHCRCDSSRQRALLLRPINDRLLLNKELQRVEEYRQTLVSGGYFPDFLFDDFFREANLLAKQGSLLSEAQFNQLRSACEIVNNLLRFLRERSISFPALLELSSDIPENKIVAELIEEIIDGQAQVRSNASPELQKIRSELNSKRREADRKFRSYINDMKKRGWLRDNEENFYNNRRVLAVPSEHKRDLKGIVHGKSESGKTTFIEPEGLIELNNEVAELEQDERNEVFHLLRELTYRLRPHAPLILRYHEFLTAMDLLRAKAYFSREIDARLPAIADKPDIRLINAYHPLLYLQNKAAGLPVVPLNVTLDKENRILIISGPNAGGKSITLKTVGLLQLMLQSGLPVPVADGSVMSYFQHLLADIGDSQSIENALSTYSSRLIKMNHFLRMANGKSLVLIDEFGTGTDPELGGAIAEVVLEELNRRNSFGIFTTHYTNIKLLADHLSGVRNASMLFDPETLRPLYKLLIGQPGSSYTFEVAEKMGLPKHVLDRAKKKVQKDKLRLNNMLSDLHRQKHHIEEELRQLRQHQQKAEAAGNKYEQLSEKLTARLEKEKSKQEDTRKLTELGRKFLSLTEEWAKTKDRKAVIKKFVGTLTAEQKRKAAENTPEKLAKKRQILLEKLRNEIVVGSTVRMMKSKQTGVVEEIKKDKVQVNFGNLRGTVALINLELVVDEKK
jgi:DNA mismatch repair protein MutS2